MTGLKKFALLVSAVSAIVVLGAAPALAKGPLVPIPGKLVITGPGLEKPIVLQGKVYSFDYWAGGSGAPSSQITLVLRQLGLIDAGPEVGWYELTPDPSTLGPGYAIEYYLHTKDGGGVIGFGSDVPLRATLYPYAPERPLVGPASPDGSKVGQWWSAPPALRTWLVSHGVPATASVASPVAPRPLTLPKAPAAEAVPWAVLFAVTGLLAMVVTAAVAGRRAQIRLNRSA